MKNILFILLVIFTLNSCEQDKFPSEISKLPPATKSGKNTIGCLVNGKALVPYGYLQNKRVCQYDGQNLAIGVAEERNNEIHAAQVFSYNYKLLEGQVYKLHAYGNNSKSGAYTIYTDTGYHAYYTNSGIGELKITRLDTVKFFVSGTFWFDAVDENGEVVKVREGRFDLLMH